MSYESLTLQIGNFETFPSGLCSPFLPSHFVCCTHLTHWLNFTTVFVAPLLITLKTATIHPTSSISSPLQKVAVKPPQLDLPRGQVTALLPVAMIVVILTPPGLIIGKATGQAIGHHQTAISTAQATTQATLTPLGLTPGRAIGPTVKAKEAAQVSTILRWTMARLCDCLTAACKAFSLANAKGKGVNELVTRSLDD